MQFLADIKLETHNTVHRVTRDLKSLNMKLFIPIML